MRHHHQGFSQGIKTVLHVPDIEAKLAEVIAAGGTLNEPARDVGGGQLVASFTDADGNVIGLQQDR